MMARKATIPPTSNRPGKEKRRPGPRSGVRPDSAKSKQKERFLSHLSTDGRVHAASRKAHVPYSRLCAWRRTDASFEIEVQQTIALAKEKELERLEEIAVQRGTEGRSRPIFHYSKARGEAIKVGEEKIPSDLLLLARLRRLDPAYATPGAKISVTQQVAIPQVRLNDQQLDAINGILESLTAQQQGREGRAALPQPQRKATIDVTPQPAREPATVAAPRVEELPGDSAMRPESPRNTAADASDEAREREAMRQRLAALGPDQIITIDSKKIF